MAVSDDRRTVLVLAYEFPPSGGGGVQRVAKMCRYLPVNGWSPIVVTADVKASRAVDDTLLEGLEGVPVRRVRAFDPRDAAARMLAPLKRLRRAGAASVETERAPRERTGPPVSTRVASWVAVPDHAAYWIGPAVRAAVEEGRAHRVRVLYASAPPPSALVAGARAAATLGVPFVADMRDAWRDNPGARYATPLHRSRSATLERRVMRAAAAVTCISDPIAEEAASMGAGRVVVLPNGFDPADIPAWEPASGDLHVAFMGQMYAAHSDPAPLLDALVIASERSPAAARVTFDVIGQGSPFAIDAVRARGLEGRVVFHGYRPHAEALRMLAAADVGVVLIRDVAGAKASYTGKIFEYLAVGLPILLLGPTDGVAADLLREARAGTVVAYDDPPACAEALVRMAEAKARGERPQPPVRDVVRRYDRREQAAALAHLLDDVEAEGVSS